ncbi:hypothetical protein ACJ41O_011609 [Fusarium nematophilum]
MAVNVFYGRQRRFASRRLTYVVLAVLLFSYAVFVNLPPRAEPAPMPNDAGENSEPEKGKSSVTSLSQSITKGMSGWNPFRQPSHRPPMRDQDSYQGTSWWADWKWLSVPFSSSLTLDEDRALLPPLRERPFIYCYYDATVKKTREEKDAESDLLLTWRRAWWAQGFRPTILGASEAMSNPLYEELQRLEVDPDLKNDLMKWLAWDTMGTGILSDYTLFPMAPAEDPLLTFLRRGDYPNLTRWKGLDSALIVGKKEDVSRVIGKLMDSPELKTAKTLIEGSVPEAFKLDKAPDSLAHYTPELIKSNYFKVHESITNGRAKGLGSLNRLINAHLHIAWQSSFPDGIQVLKPFPEHTTGMVAPALKLAKSLAFCPDNPIPLSCPPRLYGCLSCATGTAMKVNTPEHYHNSSRTYAIGTVPHPWTLATLSNLRERIDVAWIRKESPRDPWLEAVTQGLLGERVSSNLRIMRFKQAVADEHAPAHALWLTSESDIPQGLDWQFGFRIPRGLKTDSQTSEEKAKRTEEPQDNRPEKPQPQPQPQPEELPLDVQLSLQETQNKERALLERAKRVVALTKLTTDTRLRASLEAWNLADTEAWKFARAFLARRSLERVEWEKEEARYSGGSGSEKGRSAWSRWRDTKESRKK